MAVTDNKIHPDAKLAWKCVSAPIVSATSQADLKEGGFKPGFAFEVERVEVYAKTVTATISVDVKIGTTSVLSAAITPVADTPTAGTVSTTVANRRGAATDTVFVHYTSNGTGAVTKCTVYVWIRPIPANGEIYSV